MAGLLASPGWLMPSRLARICVCSQHTGQSVALVQLPGKRGLQQQALLQTLTGFPCVAWLIIMRLPISAAKLHINNHKSKRIIIFFLGILCEAFVVGVNTS